MPTEKAKQPQIFLCHASEDKAQVVEIYNRLKQDGFRPWLDKKDLLPGQQWQLEIPKAIKDSDFVLIFLSKTSVGKQGYVQKEFKLSLDVLQEIPKGEIYVIPVRLDDCQVPNEFHELHWANLFEEEGFNNIIKSIQVGMKSRSPISEIKTEKKEITAAKSEQEKIEHLKSLDWGRLFQPITPPKKKTPLNIKLVWGVVFSIFLVSVGIYLFKTINAQLTNKPEEQPTEQLDKTSSQPTPRLTKYSLRKTSRNNFSTEKVKGMLSEKGFYDSVMNMDGVGIDHKYESKTINGDKVVIDHATGLTWQQSGSLDEKIGAREYIRELNTKKFANFTGWRLPTLEEAMSLMEPMHPKGWYVDPVFDNILNDFWTLDWDRGGAWHVSFFFGGCYRNSVHPRAYVRAVR